MSSQQLDKAVWRKSQEMARAKTKIKCMKDELDHSALSGNLKRLVDDLDFCVKNDKFEGRDSAVAWVGDIIHQIRLHNSDTGKESTGMRWSESTQRIFATLTKFGGPKCHRVLQSNVGGMNQRTTER